MDILSFTTTSFENVLFRSGSNDVALFSRLHSCDANDSLSLQSYNTTEQPLISNNLSRICDKYYLKMHSF